MKNVFGFLQESPLEGEPDFPNLNGTTWDYWRSDKGRTESGGVVTSWSGQISGNNFISGSTGGPTVSGSNALYSGKDTITFDGVDQSMGNTQTTPLNGADTGSINMAIFATPHGDGGDWGAIFGISSDGNTPLITEAVMKASGNLVIDFFGYPPGQTAGLSDDTYGKGLYTITQGDPDGLGQSLSAKIFNKATTQAAGLSYSAYENDRQPFMLGGYNALNAADLFGKVDVAGVVIWFNSTDLQADITAIETYFEAIFGT